MSVAEAFVAGSSSISISISSSISISRVSLAGRAKARRFLRLMGVAAGMVLVGCAPEEVVEKQPEMLTVASPFDYPVALWDAKVEGETLLMAHVTDVGGVDSVYVLEASGQPAFDSAAVAGARELRFAPGRRGDERIAMWVRLPVRFRMSEAADEGSE